MLTPEVQQVQDDWSSRRFAISCLIDYLIRKRPEIIEEIEKIEPLQLFKLTQKYANKSEYDAFMNYIRDLSSDVSYQEKGEATSYTTIYANILNYGLPMCAAENNTQKTEMVGFNILLKKTIDIIKTIMVQLPLPTEEAPGS